MDNLQIGGDDHRILTYARLVDPEVWPEEGDPEVNAQTSTRLRRSIEAGHRIASYEGGVADPSDAVARLCLCYGLVATNTAFPVLPGLDPSRIAELALLLQGEGAEHEDAPEDDEVDLSAPPIADEDDHDSHRREDVVADDPPTEPETADYNHDAEAGIAYVGDPDDDQDRGDRR